MVESGKVRDYFDIPPYETQLTCAIRIWGMLDVAFSTSFFHVGANSLQWGQDGEKNSTKKRPCEGKVSGVSCGSLSSRRTTGLADVTSVKVSKETGSRRKETGSRCMTRRKIRGERQVRDDGGFYVTDI